MKNEDKVIEIATLIHKAIAESGLKIKDSGDLANMLGGMAMALVTLKDKVGMDNTLAISMLSHTVMLIPDSEEDINEAIDELEEILEAYGGYQKPSIH